MSICICCNARDEEKYILEWVTYYALLGVDHFYIYDNNNDRSLLWKALAPSKYIDRITVVWKPGRYVNQRMVEHFMKHYKDKHEYAMWIDCDEFVYGTEHTSIKALIDAYLVPRPHAGALMLNWMLFGDSYLETYNPRPVTERFVYREKCQNQHVKGIVATKYMTGRIYTHGFTLSDNKIQIDARGNRVEGPYNPHHDCTDLCFIAHYFCKTKEEYWQKVGRGACDWHPRHRRPEEDFHRHNKNEVFDYRICQLYKSLLEKDNDKVLLYVVYDAFAREAEDVKLTVETNEVQVKLVQASLVDAMPLIKEDVALWGDFKYVGVVPGDLFNKCGTCLVSVHDIVHDIVQRAAADVIPLLSFKPSAGLDFYEHAVGLYGPEFIKAWYALLQSVGVSDCYKQVDHMFLTGFLATPEAMKEYVDFALKCKSSYVEISDPVVGAAVFDRLAAWFFQHKDNRWLLPQRTQDGSPGYAR